MVWSKVNTHDGRVRYIKGRYPHFYLSRDKKGALEDIPEGWDVVTKNGTLRLIRKN